MECNGLNTSVDVGNDSNADISNNNGTSVHLSTQSKIVVVLYVTSSLCLVATVFILLTFSKPQNRHTKILLGHASSLMVLYSINTIRQFLVHVERNKTLCYVTFATRYYSATTAIIWISVMSYDVWLYLSELQPSIQICSRQRQWTNCGCRKRKNRFVFYSVVAWGLPLFALVTVVIIDRDRMLQDAFKLYPEIAIQCWFPERRLAVWIFMHGPVIVLFVFNSIFFTLTVATIRHTYENCKSILNRDRGIQQFTIYIKLFAIMGICVLGAAVVFSIDNQAMNWLGYVCDGMQGIAIFIAHFCKRSTLELLKQKFCFVSR